MSIELIVKIAAVGVLTSVLHMVLTKAGRDDIAMAVSIAAITVVMMIVVQMLGTMFTDLQRIFGLN